MRDTLRIECLLEAIQNYSVASGEERKARESYDGYSWGYHGHRFIEAKERAAEEVDKHLNEIIAIAVKRQLGPGA